MRNISLGILWALYAFSTSVHAQQVKILKNEADTSFQLVRDGKPYFVNGAGGGSYMNRIPAAGGNSIRTWSTRDAKQILDSAQKHGLTVLMGLDAVPERHGFNYDDTTAVRKQFERLKQEVIKYKD